MSSVNGRLYAAIVGKDSHNICLAFPVTELMVISSLETAVHDRTVLKEKTNKLVSLTC